jgi:pimeloyl-ACP methyl ester carboxylesterase
MLVSGRRRSSSVSLMAGDCIAMTPVVDPFAGTGVSQRWVQSIIEVTSLTTAIPGQARQRGFVRLVAPTVETVTACPPDMRTRPIEVEHRGVRLSGLLAEPDGPPRALVVALHGHGMTSRYWAGPAHRDQSLLELGATVGLSVWAPDRLGYGAAAAADASLFEMFAQADFMAGAIDRFAIDHPHGAGVFLVGHSFGLKLALAIAARTTSVPLIGIDGSGTGLKYTFVPGVTKPPTVHGDAGAPWGPAHLYPPATFDREISPAVPMVAALPTEAAAWPDDLRTIGPRITVPVRMTFAEHDRLWQVSDEHFDDLRAVLTGPSRVDFEVQRDAGHNLSLGWAARSYHLKVLAFAHECVLAHDGVDR